MRRAGRGPAAVADGKCQSSEAEGMLTARTARTWRRPELSRQRGRRTAMKSSKDDVGGSRRMTECATRSSYSSSMGEAAV